MHWCRRLRCLKGLRYTRCNTARLRPFSIFSNSLRTRCASSSALIAMPPGRDYPRAQYELVPVCSYTPKEMSQIILAVTWSFPSCILWFTKGYSLTVCVGNATDPCERTSIDDFLSPVTNVASTSYTVSSLRHRDGDDAQRTDARGSCSHFQPFGKVLSALSNPGRSYFPLAPAQATPIMRWGVAL